MLMLAPSDTSRPVIYLDSSDFSNLSNIGKADWQAHRARLKEMTEADLAEFGFSAVHVMEITHVDAESKRWSPWRARVIKDLCIGKCLMFWNELVFAEGPALVQGRTLGSTEVYRDDGRWTPAIDIAARERRRGISRRDWERSVVESDVGRIPALDIVLDATLAHLRRNASPGAKSKLLDSSFADLLHLAYLPYVDVLRCDAETAQVATAVAQEYGTRVAASFKDVMRLFDSTVQEPRAQPA